MNFQKYLKYKQKYLNLKQLGGENIIKLTKNNYTLTFNKTALLGQGSFGSVYQGTLEKDGEIHKVAIKLIKYNNETKDDILHELKILTEINKDGCREDILCYYDYIDKEDDKTIYIITRLVKGCIELNKTPFIYNKDDGDVVSKFPSYHEKIYIMLKIATGM